MQCKVHVINEMSRAQNSGKAALSAGPAEMRVVGFDHGGHDLLMGLLHADPGQRLTAFQVRILSGLDLSHLVPVETYGLLCLIDPMRLLGHTVHGCSSLPPIRQVSRIDNPMPSALHINHPAQTSAVQQVNERFRDSAS